MSIDPARSARHSHRYILEKISLDIISTYTGLCDVLSLDKEESVNTCCSTLLALPDQDSMNRDFVMAAAGHPVSPGSLVQSMIEKGKELPLHGVIAILECQGVRSKLATKIVLPLRFQSSCF